MQSRGETVLSRDQVDVALNPMSQRVTSLIFGGQSLRRVGAGFYLVAENSHDQIGALREMPI